MDVVTGEQTTFQQMRENSIKCALWLQKTLVFNEDNNTYDDVITICTCNPINAYIPYLAGLYINAMVNPWDEEYFQGRLTFY